MRTWSQDFLNKENSGFVDDLHTMMVYIPAGKIKSTVQEAIRDNLRCKESHVDLLMTHVQEGEGVAIVIDALNEIRDEKVRRNVEQYVQERQMRGGPQVIVSARTDLCTINSLDFDLHLSLKGFSNTQGKLYSDTFFGRVSRSEVDRRDVLRFLNEKEAEMEVILQSPLRLHVFCALTARGFLELDDSSISNTHRLFEQLESCLLSRESQREDRQIVTDQESLDFYRMCLLAILSGLREFPKAMLEKFNISESFHVFLDKHDTLGPDGVYTSYYSFQHEMLFEYFASRAIENLPLPGLNSLLLLVCRNASLRNVQKLMFQLLLKNNNEELALAMLRIIIYFQIEEARVIPILEYLWDIDSDKSITESLEGILKSDTEGWKKDRIDSSWRAINQDFDKHAKEKGLFHKLEKNGILAHIVDCLRQCGPQPEERILKETLFRLLPCEFVQLE